MTTSTMRGLRAAAGVALGACALSACTDGGGGNPTTTASTSATSSATTSAPPTTSSAPTNGSDGVPAAAKAHTDAGAVAFVRYVIAQNHRARMTPDPKALAGLCLPTSKSCASNMELAEELASKKQRIDRETLTIKDARSDGMDGALQRVIVDVHQNETYIVNANGSRLESASPDRDGSFVYFLQWKERWFVAEIKVADTP